MQHISLINDATEEFIHLALRKKGISEIMWHPQEDYLNISEDPPVFVVADGVTLDFLQMHSDGEEYPNPSPSGEVARIFCEEVVRATREHHEALSEKSLVDIFHEANRAVHAYNAKQGENTYAGNPTGLYAATMAFLTIKEGKAYWASLCDSFVAHFDSEMNKYFMSTGICEPYAVVNGEEKMAEYVQTGVFDIAEGDRVFVLTDGFEAHMKHPDFQSLFLDWDDTLKPRIEAFTEEKNAESPADYGRERSLIAVSV